MAEQIRFSGDAFESFVMVMDDMVGYTLKINGEDYSLRGIGNKDGFYVLNCERFQDGAQASFVVDGSDIDVYVY